ncbi:hypothetical protein, partial [Cupriavidus sp. 8B]
MLGQKIAELQQSPIWNDSPAVQPGFDSNAAYNQLVGAFGESRGGYGSDTPSMTLAANNLRQPGQPLVMSDAGSRGYGSADAHDARVAELRVMAGQALSEGDRFNVDGSTANVLIQGIPPQQLPDIELAQAKSGTPVWVDPETGVEVYAVPYPQITATRLPEAGISDLNRLGQSFLGTAQGAGTFALDAARFVSDQGWVLANGVTGGWLANNVDAAQAAVQRNTALGQSILNAPGAVARFGLRAMTG